MSIQAANLFANVSVTGGASSAAALRTVGGEVTSAQSALSRMGGAGSLAGKALGVVERGAGGASSAFTHMKGTLGGLLGGPLGFLGLGAGALGVAGALETGINTTLNLADALEKLVPITHDSATSLSALIAVGGRYGLSSDQIVTSAAFAEKTIQKLADTMTGKGSAAVSKLTAFQKQYGISLVDSKGQAVDYETELLRIADYMGTARGKTDGATVAAQLLGKGYANMAPLLALGSAGILAAEKSAADLGLVLDQTNVGAVMRYQDTMKNLHQAVGGLVMQLSIALIPAVTDVAQSITSFVSNQNNRAGILTFFNGLISGARTAAGVLTGTVIPDLQSLAGAALGFWNGIPAPLRDLITKGLIADRAMKFLFGFDPATAIGSIIAKQLLGGLASGLGDVLKKGLGAIGGSVASKVAGGVAGALDVQKVFVVNMAEGGLAGAAGGAAGGAEEAAGGLAIGTIAVAAAAVVAAAIAGVLAVKFAQDNAATVDIGNKVVAQTATYVTASTTSAQDIQNTLNGINGQESGLLSGIALNLTNGFNGGKDKLDAVKAALQARLDQMVALGDRGDKSADTIAANQLRQNSAFGGYLGKAADDIVGSGTKQTHAVDLVRTAVNDAKTAAAAHAAAILAQEKLQTAKDNSVTVNLTTTLNGDTLSKSSIKLKSGVRVT